MIVKPQTFKRGGRFSTARERAEYLQKDGRELGVATQNVNDEAKWWNELDRTTDRYHLRGDVVAREFVLSPSPEDNVTPEQMLKFGREWASPTTRRRSLSTTTAPKGSHAAKMG